MDDPSTPAPSLLRWGIGFLVVGMAWGLTTPFIRRGAASYDPAPRPELSDPARSWLLRKLLAPLYAVVDVLSHPAYAVPLALNLTGSVWFFLLVGEAGKFPLSARSIGGSRAQKTDDGVELSLTVPITNSLAFMFTVLGEWWVEGRGISKDTIAGMGLVLGGIALCVQAKTDI